MARISRKQKGDTRVMCKDCKHAYGYHELDYKGEPFMCHCRAKGDYGAQYSEFIDVKHECSRFVKKG